jgi:quinol monooxygenase YgiN
MIELGQASMKRSPSLWLLALLSIAITCVESNHTRSLKPMNEIQGVARLKIHDGKLEEFKRVVSQFMQVARTKDTGTLQYELYFNGDQTECLVLERYRDVPSLLQHQNNIGGLMDALLKTCTGSGVACGKPTPELVKALEGSPVQLFTPYQTL